MNFTLSLSSLEPKTQNGNRKVLRWMETITTVCTKSELHAAVVITYWSNYTLHKCTIYRNAVYKRLIVFCNFIQLIDHVCLRKSECVKGDIL